MATLFSSLRDTLYEIADNDFAGGRVPRHREPVRTGRKQRRFIGLLTVF
jgi:hypothetical protein